MHGLTTDKELDYWRERAKKAEGERDEARRICGVTERDAIAMREKLSHVSWAATELERVSSLSVSIDDAKAALVANAALKDENARLTTESERLRGEVEAMKALCDAAAEWYRLHSSGGRFAETAHKHYVDLCNAIGVFTKGTGSDGE